MVFSWFLLLASVSKVVSFSLFLHISYPPLSPFPSPVLFLHYILLHFLCISAFSVLLLPRPFLPSLLPSVQTHALIILHDSFSLACFWCCCPLNVHLFIPLSTGKCRVCHSTLYFLSLCSHTWATQLMSKLHTLLVLPCLTFTFTFSIHSLLVLLCCSCPTLTVSQVGNISLQAVHVNWLLLPFLWSHWITVLLHATPPLKQRCIMI